MVKIYISCVEEWVAKSVVAPDQNLELGLQFGTYRLWHISPHSHFSLTNNNIFYNCMLYKYVSSVHLQPTMSIHPQHKTLELHKAEFCHNVLDIPTDVDHWLVANIWCGQIILFLVDLLKLSDVKEDGVACKVKRITTKVHPHSLMMFLSQLLKYILIPASGAGPHPQPFHYSYCQNHQTFATQCLSQPSSHSWSV